MGELSFVPVETVVVRRERAAHVGVTFGLSVVAVGGLAAAHGGYFPSAWGWVIVAGAMAAAFALSRSDMVRLSGTEIVFLTGLGALCGWYAVSAIWGSPAAAIAEAARCAVYVVLAGCALAVASRRSASAIAIGVAAATTLVAAYSLATRLFPDRVGTFDSIAVYRLSTPIGYWNGLGLLCAVGLLATIAVVGTAETASRAATAAAAGPVLLLALYFTFSRGSWLALSLGFAAAFALTESRLRLIATSIAVAVPGVIAVVVASRSPALTHQKATLARATTDGHQEGLLVLGLILVAAALAVAARRVPDLRTADRVFGAAVLVMAIAAAIGVVAHYGGPASTARKAWSSFAAPPPRHQTDLTQRLFSFSGNHRVELWHAAAHEFEAHPLVGSGGGSFEQYWLQHRTVAGKVRDAHSLYLETLGELGIIGLLLLVVALGAPLVAGVQARRRPGVAALTGAYAAYLVGAGVDWDWELASVTGAALLIGAAILVAARGEEHALSTRARYTLLAAALAVGVFGFVFLVGNMFLSRANSAAAAGKWTTAATDARRAGVWLPWSTDPQRQLGEAQLAYGDTKAAQSSFHAAIAKDRTDWNLWLDLARATTGKQQQAALAQATKLDPLGPEIREFKAELATQPSITLGGNG